MRADPVAEAACPGRLGEGVVTGAEHGDKHVRLAHLPGKTIDHPYRLASVVDEHLFAGPVLLAQDDIDVLRPLPVQLAGFTPDCGSRGREAVSRISLGPESARTAYSSTPSTTASLTL